MQGSQTLEANRIDPSHFPYFRGWGGGRRTRMTTVTKDTDSKRESLLDEAVARRRGRPPPPRASPPPLALGLQRVPVRATCALQTYVQSVRLRGAQAAWSSQMWQRGISRPGSGRHALLRSVPVRSSFLSSLNRLPCTPLNVFERSIFMPKCISGDPRNCCVSPSLEVGAQ